MTIKAGIVGCGAVANWAHAPAFKTIKDATMVACSDKDAERAKAFAQKWDIPRHYSSYKKMIEEESLDVVSICTPNYTHKEVTLLALEAGINVLCEKPMAMNAGEAREMLEASRRSKGLLTIAHQHRFTREAQALKRFIEEGELGEIYFVRSQALCRRSIPGWGEFHKKSKSAGGALIDNGVHIIDLSLWLMGRAEPQAASGAILTKFGNRSDVGMMASCKYDWREFDVEDFACGFIRFTNGAVMSVETAWAANIEEDVRLTQQLLGDKGGATLYPFRLFLERKGVLLDVTPRLSGEFNAYVAEVERFIAAIRGEQDLLVKPEECYVVMQIIDALYQSASERREVVFGTRREVTAPAAG
jgi:predicted dehydrogenase